MRAAATVPSLIGRWRLDQAALLAFLFGSISALTLVSLPPEWVVRVSIVVAPILISIRRTRWVGWWMLGAALCVLHAQSYLDRRLQASEAGEYDFRVSVVGLPTRDAQSIRFEARVLDAGSAPQRLRGERIRLTRYDADWDTAPGDTWAVRARLRAPRGLANPGGFDAERYAAQRGLVATGIVSRAEQSDLSGSPMLQLQQRVDRWRLRLSARLRDSGADTSRFLRGLAVGDTRGLDDRDWDILRATGISHLLAISGLHIGLVAGLAALLVRLIYRLAPLLASRVPLLQASAFAAWIAGSSYAVLAGLALPTLRALLMLGLFCMLVVLRRRARGMHVLVLSAAVMVVLDPLAMLGAGFWLSFLGVAWLLLCLPSTETAPARNWMMGLLRAQAVLVVGLLPLTVLFFGQTSLVGPFVNLIAVPWVSLVTVPLTLAVAVAPVPDLLAGALLWSADHSMQWIWFLAEWAASLAHGELYLTEPSTSALLAAIVAAVWLLAPRGVPGKPLAPLLLLPMLWPESGAPAQDAFRIDVFDVGQGTSVLVRTRNHALLYDTGAAFRNGGDMGDQTVVPALRSLGVRGLDLVVISHADGDHAGGAASVVRAFPEVRIVSGEPESMRVKLGDAPGHCSQLAPFEWDGVRFELLHPPEHFPELGNESSCVLRIDNGGQSALLVGDIGEVIEQRLVREAGNLGADLLLVAHHGSRSSSSAAFVASVHPAWSVVSAGHQNRFGHPHADVVGRLEQAGSVVLQTPRSGMLTWSSTMGRETAPRARRVEHGRWWTAAE